MQAEASYMIKISRPEFNRSCLNLQNIVTQDSLSDISAANLAQEILSFMQF